MKNLLKSSLFLLILLVGYSCKSSEVLTSGNVTNISDIKLRNQLLQQALNYNKLYSKKASITFNDGNKKTSFKGSYVIQKDSIIIVSVIALMGIEVVRAQFTPDSVIILDKHNKKAILTNYSFFYDKFDMDIDFFMLQQILTNGPFVYPADDDLISDLKKYKHDIKDDYYTFSTVKHRRYNRLNKRQKNDVVTHQMAIYPDLFRIKDHYIKDFGNNRTVEIQYNSLKKFSSTIFPQFIKVDASQGSKQFNLDIETNYIEINDGGSLHFKVPSSYEIISY